MSVVAKTPRFQFEINGTANQVYHLATGEGLPRHQHGHPHVTACYAGRIMIRKQDKEKIMDRNSTPVLLAALEWHEIEALEDGTVIVNTFVTVTEQLHTADK